MSTRTVRRRHGARNASALLTYRSEPGDVDLAGRPRQQLDGAPLVGLWEVESAIVASYVARTRYRSITPAMFDTVILDAGYRWSQVRLLDRGLREHPEHGPSTIALLAIAGTEWWDSVESNVAHGMAIHAAVSPDSDDARERWARLERRERAFRECDLAVTLTMFRAEHVDERAISMFLDGAAGIGRPLRAREEDSLLRRALASVEANKSEAERARKAEIRRRIADVMGEPIYKTARDRAVESARRAWGAIEVHTGQPEA